MFDCQSDPEGSFYTMRLLEGETLSERLSRAKAEKKRVPVGEAVEILIRICETIASAHDKGIMHLDLKPANVVVQSYRQVSVIDWGLAKSQC